MKSTVRRRNEGPTGFEVKPRRCLAWGLVLAAVLASPMAAQMAAESTSPAPSSGQTGICQKDYNPFWGYDGRFGTIASQPPSELLRNANVALASCFSWQTLLALSHSPSHGTLVNTGAEGPTHWESWKTIDEIFPHQPLPASCRFQEADPPVVLSMVDGLTTEVQVQLGRSQNCLDVPVFDRDQRLVWREVQLDPVFVDSMGKYQAGSSGFEFASGSRALKSAWKFYDPAEDATDGYYIREMAMNDGQECTRTQMALVAIHATVKTPFFPGWVWMTFEHRTNAPTEAMLQESSATPEVDWTFYTHDSSCTVNRECEGSDGKPTGTQVVRLHTLNQSVQEVNQYWADLLPAHSVWRNYKLIGVEWSMGTGAIGTAKLTNSILETGCQNSSCFGCHSAPEATDRSYVFLHGKDPSSATTSNATLEPVHSTHGAGAAGDR